ncbi:MAG: hypothetical protein KJS91_13860 [Planctomycetes bacterium]|nr:hypothetical protein [Planctomycetota bacterium]
MSRHRDLRGDPRLGVDAPLRFLPTRFNSRGLAIDARDQVCTEIACPRCHLALPRAFLEFKSLFVSIVGAPGSGKSFFLGAAVNQLRNILARQFNLSFQDADPERNITVTDYENALFQQPDLDKPVEVANLIRKTQFGDGAGDTFYSVRYGTHERRQPRPFSFLIDTLPGHPSTEKAKRYGRIMCLYDNAGESYLPTRQDLFAEDMTAHLIRSKFLLFLFDPLQDMGFYREVERKSGRLESGVRFQSAQYVVLNEAARRVKQLLGGSPSTLHEAPLLVLVSKWDAWKGLLPELSAIEPVRPASSGLHGLDIPEVERASAMIRDLLNRLCPTIVQTAESFCREVRYMPVTALGTSPRPDPARTDSRGMAAEVIVPRDISPRWVTVPFLYGIGRFGSGLVPVFKR